MAKKPVMLCVEVLVTVVPVQNKDFEWSTTGTFSLNSNKLISLSGSIFKSDYDYFNTGTVEYSGQVADSHRVQVGESIGNFYGFKVVDVDSEGRWIYIPGFFFGMGGSATVAYNRNEYIETERPLVVITAPGPGSGKMAVCLSQLYHEYKRGVKAGYAKFETFPIWNIPLKHPVNLAYEAATADLNDVNMIDPFHLEAYGVTTVNYNRDIEIFPVVNAMFELIAGQSPYKSPTDMGVNMAGNCIVDDAVCCEASRKEIVRRYYKCLCEQKITGTAKESERYKLELLMNQAGLTMGAREVEKQAHARSEATGGAPAAAIELSDGTVITGKTGPLLGATASALINALKYLAGIPQETDLVSAAAIEPIQTLKTNYLGGKNPRLHTDEILIALSSSAASSELAAAAMHQLPNLKGCDVHSTVLLSSVDSSTLNRLGMYLTCDPVYEEEDRKYHKL